MKIIVISDLHGKSIWKKVNIDEYDKVIFIADYCDSFDHIPIEILNNLKEIVELKLNNPDKIVLLIGNHDIQYIYSNYHVLGRTESIVHELHDLFHTNKTFDNPTPLFQLAYQIDNYLFTHAGVEKAWFDLVTNKIESYIIDETSIADRLNLLYLIEFSGKEEDKLLLRNSYRRGGYYSYGSCIWSDKKGLILDTIPDMVQIVGHTAVQEIEIVNTTNNSKLVFTDVYARQAERREKKVKSKYDNYDLTEFYILTIDHL